MIFNEHLFHFISVVSELSLATVLLHVGLASRTKEEVEETLDKFVLGDNAAAKGINFRNFIAFTKKQHSIKIKNLPDEIDCNNGVNYAKGISIFTNSCSPSRWCSVAIVILFLALWFGSSVIESQNNIFNLVWIGVTFSMVGIAFYAFINWNRSQMIINMMREFHVQNNPRPTLIA